ncbi:YhgE/Pip domain-containing protein, partial [Staphylococcus aureus]
LALPAATLLVAGFVTGPGGSAFVGGFPNFVYAAALAACVPLLVAGGFLVAGMNSDSRLRTVQAAVVNLDEPVTVDGQYIPLGRQLTANLVDSDRVENLDWTLETEARARAGLATGQYAAMVLIPKNFSAAATSYAKEADEARRATIELSTSPVAGVADATLGKAVALAAASS